LHLFLGHFLACLIFILIKNRFNLESRFCGCMPDQFQNNFLGGQWFCPPVNGDKGKHRMFNIIPFGGTWRIMTNMNNESCSCGKLLQTLFPQLVLVPITTAAISKQKDLCCFFVLLLPPGIPPLGE
jgi:hypothetical protein